MLVSAMRLLASSILLLIMLGNYCLHAEDQTDRTPSAVPGLSLDALAATRDRPLFAPNRRKFIPPPLAVAPSRAAAPHQQPQKPQFDLVGIIFSASGTMVLLRDTNTSDIMTTRSGESLGGWRIVVDSTYTATVTDGKQEFTLRMFAEP
jgi:hypothetical protein